VPPLIALGVVSCNRPAYLAETLRGVAAHLSSVVDLIYIGDDGSDREHRDALCAAYDECPDAIVVSDPLNRGVAASKNRLLRMMLDNGADWLFLLEDDIVPQTPSAVLGYLAACEESGWHHLSYAWHGPANATGPVEVDVAVSYFTNYIGAYCVYSRESLKACGLYDEGFYNAWEHVEHTLRLARGGYTDPRPWHAADATGSENWLREIPGSVENSVIRTRLDWQETMERGREYWQRASPETYAMLHGPSRVKAARVDKIPEDRDARLAFVEGWAKSQHSRLAAEEQRLASEERGRPYAEEVVAQGRPRTRAARMRPLKSRLIHPFRRSHGGVSTSSRPIAVLVPSRGRPQNIVALLEAADITGTTQVRWFLGLDDDDASSYSVPKRDDLSVVVRPRHTQGVKSNQLAQLAIDAGHPVIGKLDDDHRPRTTGWDARVCEAFTHGPGLVYLNDGHQGQALPTVPFWSATIIRALGWYCHPQLEHLYGDNVWIELARAADCATYLEDVLVEHMHVNAGKAPMDAIYEYGNSPGMYERDGAVFQRYLGSDEFRADVEAVRSCVASGAAQP
jgi:hypothetical protein